MYEPRLILLTNYIYTLLSLVKPFSPMNRNAGLSAVRLPMFVGIIPIAHADIACHLHLHLLSQLACPETCHLQHT